MITAIHSGGDWYDASAEYLVLPDGMNISDQKGDWRKWYKEVYCDDLRRTNKEYGNGGKVIYISFCEWLKNHGARDVTDDELEVFDNI